MEASLCVLQLVIWGSLKQGSTCSRWTCLLVLGRGESWKAHGMSIPYSVYMMQPQPDWRGENIQLFSMGELWGQIVGGPNGIQPATYLPSDLSSWLSSKILHLISWKHHLEAQVIMSIRSWWERCFFLHLLESGLIPTEHFGSTWMPYLASSALVEWLYRPGMEVLSQFKLLSRLMRSCLEDSNCPASCLEDSNSP